MYTIMMNSDKRLTKTVVTTLYQNENLVDKLKFIIPHIYETLDISTFNAALEYTTPTGEEKSEKLQLSNEAYKENWLCGYLPIDSKLTKVAGDIILRLIFTDDNQRILKSGSTIITIKAVQNGNSNLPDEPEGNLPNDDIKHDGFEVVEF